MNNLEQLPGRNRKEKPEPYHPSLGELRAGNQAEWRRWHAALTPKLFPYAFRGISDTGRAQDAVQEAWMKVFRRITDKENPIDERNLNGYVVRTLHNVIISERRKAYERHTDRNKDGQEAAENKPDPVNIEEIVITRTWLVDSIKKLPPKHQEPLAFLAEGEDIAAIASTLGVSVEVAKQRRHRAIEALKRIIKQSEAPQDPQEPKSGSQDVLKQTKEMRTQPPQQIAKDILIEHEQTPPKTIFTTKPVALRPEPKGVDRYSSEMANQVTDLVAKNYDFQEIAAMTGVSFEAIREIIYKA